MYYGTAEKTIKTMYWRYYVSQDIYCTLWYEQTAIISYVSRMTALHAVWGWEMGSCASGCCCSTADGDHTRAPLSRRAPAPCNITMRYKTPYSKLKKVKQNLSKQSLVKLWLWTNQAIMYFNCIKLLCTIKLNSFVKTFIQDVIRY